MSDRLDRFGDWEPVRSASTSGMVDGMSPVFAGSLNSDRMRVVRRSVRREISEIRIRWYQYPYYMEDLRDLFLSMFPGEMPPEDSARFEALFSSQKSWGTESSKTVDPREYSALQLYVSTTGYQWIFRAINAAFRGEDRSKDSIRLRSAAFLVELLNIDLFNYILNNKSAANYCGYVYRGMCVSTQELHNYQRVAVQDISERYLSVPLAMVSASTDVDTALSFALAEADGSRDRHVLLWDIEIAGLAGELVAFYRTKCPKSVVTSLCAVPIDELSAFPGEREVLLRSPFLQIIEMVADDSIHSRRVYRVKAVMLNTNRDHLSTIDLSTGPDRMARDLFRTLIRLDHSRVCADRATRSGLIQDAALYRDIARDTEEALELLGYQDRSRQSDAIEIDGASAARE